MMSCFCLILIMSIALADKKVDAMSCDAPLGMEDSEIKDAQLSSVGGEGGTDGKNARINTGIGWCSRSMQQYRESIYDPNVYLQIDLLEIYKITKLEIGGGKDFKNYVPGDSAKLSYKVNQDSDYIAYEKPMPLNGIKYPKSKVIELEPPIVTRYLKYQPLVDANPRCMTMELYGCILHDSSCQKEILNSNMGYSASATQKSLSPNYIAQSNPNCCWGPGKETSMPFNESLTICLKNAYFITGVRTFQPKYAGAPKKQPDSFTLHYKHNRPNWRPFTGGSKQAIQFNTSQTLGKIEGIFPKFAATSIRVYPNQSFQRYLKMQFYGCLISDPSIFDFSTALPTTTRPVTSPLRTSVRTKVSSLHKTTTESVATKGTSYKRIKTKTTATRETKSKRTRPTTYKHPLNVGELKDKSSSTLIIVIVILVVVLFIIIVLFLVFLCRGKRKLSCRKTRPGRNNWRSKSDGNENSPEDNQLLKNLSKNPIYEVSFKNGNCETDGLYDKVPEDLGNDDSDKLIPNPWNSRHERASAVKHPVEEGTYSDVVQYESGYTQVDVDLNPHTIPPVYAEPDAQITESIEMNPIYEMSPEGEDTQIYERARNLYDGAKIYDDPYKNVTGSSLYADPDLVKERSSFKIRTFPRDKLHFLEKIGTGQFGEVHICEVDSLGSIIGSDAGHCSYIMSSTVKVAVKMLKSDVEKNIEKEFMKEVRVMARLRHENVVQLLGVCDEEPKCMVVEYMENGDLNQFLKGYTLTDDISDDAARVLNEQTLLYMCMQICGGMKYLSSQGFVHRDLATRNCLVGHSFTVKISDFGMSRYLYSKHYYRIEGRAVLPIRWMAPESLFYGTFTSQSDVWAFGVTLWEIFTFARETPYELMNDQQVIENACSIIAKEQQSFQCLPRPSTCSDHVYKLLLKCWKKSPAERPNFEELTHFFTRLVNSFEASI